MLRIFPTTVWGPVALVSPGEFWETCILQFGNSDHQDQGWSSKIYVSKNVLRANEEQLDVGTAGFEGQKDQG